MAKTSRHDAEPRTIATPFGDRGGVVIEPWLTDQWYVDAETLGAACDQGGTRWQHRDCPEDLGKNLVQLDGKYPALVCLTSALVGTQDTGLVQAQVLKQLIAWMLHREK